MKIRHLATFAVAAAVVAGSLFVRARPVPVARGPAAVLPFRIPPSGLPEELLGVVDYPGPSAVAFDSRNRPYLLHTFTNTSRRDTRPELPGVISTLRVGQWVRLSFREAVQAALPGYRLKLYRNGLGSIVIDGDDGLYVVAQVRRPGDKRKRIASVLVYSPDLGETFQAYRLPTRGWTGAFLETRTGYNLREGPPAIALFHDRNQRADEWSRLSTLSIVVPEKRAGRLVLEPVEVTRNGLGFGGHSGGYSFAASAGGLTHFVYREAAGRGGGNPVWAATYDHEKRRIVARRLLVRAEPKDSDVHTEPVIALDGRGFLHVLSGGHGTPFFYLRSLTPGSVAGEWSAPERMGERQTYATLVCTPDGTLHSVYRGEAALAYRSRPAGRGAWSPPRVLATPPEGHRGYVGFYHHLFVDRRGALYLTFTFKGPTHREIYPRALARSTDRGRTWRIARTEAMEASAGR